MVNAWYMKEAAEVSSQFERNYDAPIDIGALKSQLGVDHYTVGMQARCPIESIWMKITVCICRSMWTVWRATRRSRLSSKRWASPTRTR